MSIIDKVKNYAKDHDFAIGSAIIPPTAVGLMCGMTHVALVKGAIYGVLAAAFYNGGARFAEEKRILSHDFAIATLGGLLVSAAVTAGVGSLAEAADNLVAPPIKVHAPSR